MERLSDQGKCLSCVLMMFQTWGSPVLHRNTGLIRRICNDCLCLVSVMVVVYPSRQSRGAQMLENAEIVACGGINFGFVCNSRI